MRKLAGEVLRNRCNTGSRSPRLKPRWTGRAFTPDLAWPSKWATCLAIALTTRGPLFFSDSPGLSGRGNFLAWCFDIGTFFHCCQLIPSLNLRLWVLRSQSFVELRVAWCLRSKFNLRFLHGDTFDCGDCPAYVEPSPLRAIVQVSTPEVPLNSIVPAHQTTEPWSAPFWNIWTVAMPAPDAGVRI